MEIEYGSDYENVIFVLEHLELPISYKLNNKENIFKLYGDMLVSFGGKEFLGFKNIIKKIYELFPKNFAYCLVTDEIIALSEEINNADTKKLVDFIHKIQKNEFITSSQISSVSFAEFVLFFKLMKARDEKLNKTVTDWMKKFKEENKINIMDFSQLEIRVGKIMDIWDHPNADTLYVESVDIGRKIQVISGLRNICGKDDLRGKCFLFMVNLKISKLRGEKSEGMILCAKGNGIVRPIPAPVEMPGEILYIGAQKTFSEIKKIDKNSEIFKSLMSDLLIREHKMVFRDKEVLCSGICVNSDVVTDGIVS